MRIAFVDIETTAFDAEFGRLLTVAIKPLGGRAEVFAITKKDRLEAEDIGVIAPALDRINDFDMIVTFNGYYFDVPFLNARGAYYGLSPIRADIKHVDLFFVMKRNFKLANKSLEAACRFFGITGKTSLNPKIWAKAHVWDKDALDYIIRHNRNDVVILERLYKRVVPYLGQIRSVRY